MPPSKCCVAFPLHPQSRPQSCLQQEGGFLFTAASNEWKPLSKRNTVGPERNGCILQSLRFLLQFKQSGSIPPCSAQGELLNRKSCWIASDRRASSTLPPLITGRTTARQRRLLLIGRTISRSFSRVSSPLRHLMPSPSRLPGRP